MRAWCCAIGKHIDARKRHKLADRQCAHRATFGTGSSRVCVSMRGAVDQPERWEGMLYACARVLRACFVLVQTSNAPVMSLVLTGGMNKCIASFDSLM